MLAEKDDCIDNLKQNVTKWQAYEEDEKDKQVYEIKE